MKKKISLIIALLLITVASTTSFAADIPNVSVAEKDSVSTFIDSLDKSSYGGAYYDDNGTLVVLSMDKEVLTNNPQIKAAMTLGGSSISIQLIDGRYSMKQLETAKEKLLAQASKYDILAVGFYELENSLAVYTSDISDANRLAIQTEANVDHIKFFFETDISGNKPPTEDAGAETAPFGISPTVKPGQWVAMSRIGGNWSTLMVPVVRNYQTSSQQLGFLTIGHGWQVGDAASVAGVALGTVSNVWRGTYTDAAFIPSNRTQSLTSTTGRYITARGAPVANTTVWMEGANGERSGRVVATGISFSMSARTNSPTYPAQSYNGCFSMTLTPEDGDSGGAVISQSGSNYSLKGNNIGYFRETKQGVACTWDYLENSYGVLPAQLN